MNAEAKQTSTDVALIQRVQVALKSSETERQLTELAATSKSITTITNADGRAQCHSSRMALKRMRVEIGKTGKSAREDAQAFTNAVLAEEKRLIGLIAPEESRLEKLQEAWDAEREREKQAKIEAEKKRVAAIQERIEAIRQNVVEAAGETAAQIQERIETLVAMPIDAANFAELLQQAEGARETTLVRLRIAHGKIVAQEAEQQRLAEEKARLEAERVEEEKRQAAERERLRQQQAELDRQRQEQERAEADARRRREEEEREAARARKAEEERHAEQLRQQREESERQERERQARIEQEERERRERLEAEEAERRQRAQAEEQERQERIAAEERERQLRIETEEARLAEQRAALAREQDELNRIREAGGGATAVAPAEESGDSRVENAATDPTASITSGPEATPPQGTDSDRPTDDEIIGLIVTYYEVDEQTAVKWLLEMDLRAPHRSEEEEAA